MAAEKLLQTAIRADASLTATSTPAARVFTDTNDHELVQRRLGMVYGFVGVVSLFFWLFGVVTASIVLPERFWELHLSGGKLGHLLVSVVLISVWAICRGKPRSRWFLSAMDIAGATKVTAAASVIVAFAPPGFRIEWVGLTMFIVLMSLRSALVPSPPRWTVLVSAVASIPVPIGAYESTLRDPTWNQTLFPRGILVLIVAIWCIAGVMATYAISKIVYGLRSEVKSATQLGQYMLEEKIGEGGMGVVYRARHALLRRPTAIKLLSPERTQETHARRFEREVQITASLTHPNTIAVYDFGHTREGVFYYAMELLDGVTLQELVIDEGPQSPARTIHILAQMAGALEEAHGAGLVHRDVKPANVFLCERGGVADFVKVLDFGLVKEQGRPDPMLSRADAIAGTPLYMAPESITRPDEVDARVDLYALGGVGYWLVTGEPPFSGTNLVEICSHHIHTIPDRPSARLAREGRASMPEELEEIILGCLEKKPEARPQTAREIGERLRTLQSAHPWSADDARRARARSRPPSVRASDRGEKSSAKAPAQPRPVPAEEA
jgi:eukaryotic-like serine/threonine-protein kinase